MKQQSALKIIDHADTLALMEFDELILAVERAYLAQAQGRASPSQYINMKVNGNLVHFKAGYIENAQCFAIKYSGGFLGNQGSNAPIDPGYVVAHDAKSGVPKILFLDDGAITNYRTAAAGAVAVKWLSNAESKTIGIVGTGVQARLQVEAALRVRPNIAMVKAWGRSAEKLGKYLEDMRSKFPCVEFLGCAEPRDAISEADIVITTTASCAPIVLSEWIAAGTLIVAVGACAPEMQELDPAVLKMADKIYADSVERCIADGEIHHALQAKLISRADISGELGAALAGQIPGREHATEIIVFDMVGLGILDAATVECLEAKIVEAAK